MKAQKKEILRSIRQSKNRFLSILAIVALGTGFFAGIKAACPDMKETAAQYFDNQNLMDLKIVSTLGFVDKDIQAIQAVDENATVVPAYSSDFLLGEDESKVIRVYGLDLDTLDSEDAVNKPVLKEGRMPERSGECVVEQSVYTPDFFQVGQTITLAPGSSDSAVDDYLSTDTYTIVGIVESPLYISIDRGTSQIGNGGVNSFIMVPQTDFILEAYTEVYIRFGDVDLDPFSQEYEDFISTRQQEYEAVGDVREQERYDEIMEQAQTELDEGKQELADGQAEFDEQFGQAEQDLRDAQTTLDEGWQAYRTGVQEFQTQIQQGQQEIDDGWAEYREGLAQYEDGLAQYEEGLREFEAQRPQAEQELRDAQAQLDAGWQEYEDGLAAYEQGVNSLALLTKVVGDYEHQAAAEPYPQEVQQALEIVREMEPTLVSAFEQYLTMEPSFVKSMIKGLIDQELQSQQGTLDEAKTQLDESKTLLDQGQQEIDDGWAALEATEQTLADTKTQLDAAKTELDSGYEELVQGQTTLDNERAQGEQQLEDSREELIAGQQEIDDGWSTFYTEKADAQAQLDDAQAQVDDAEEQLQKVKVPQWYVQDRTSNPDYGNFAQDAERVDAVAKVFPVFFILVAALICLTTMTRMVEEERTQIGTMKALGYNASSIISKYLWYAAAASLLGSAVGLAIGMKLLPYIIYSIYQSMMYHLPDLIAPYRWDYIAACTVVAVLCTTVSAYFACRKELTAQPATLMRPKPPKNGKRVFLERLPWLWRRMSFMTKVTVRNILRYKGRVFLTVVGIAGCTALMLAGFGLKDSIGSVVNKQYGEIFAYDFSVVVSDEATDSQVLEAQSAIDANSLVEDTALVRQESLYAQAGDAAQQEIYLTVPQLPENLETFIHLHERQSGAPLTLSDNGIIINEKLGQLLNVEVGDTITLTVGSGSSPVQVTVLGLSENYAMNFAYMTPTLYKEVFGQDPFYNSILGAMTQDTEENEDQLSRTLLELDNVLQVSFSSDTRASFETMMGSFDAIILLLIACAGALAVVVLYNLTNININERIRELATIKVLGFYDREVSSYIYRESIFSMILGILVGLVMGVALHRFVVLTAEVDQVMFSRSIEPLSFLWAALLTMVFTFLVNFVMHFHLKKIDMVESMKSIE